MWPPRREEGTGSGPVLCQYSMIPPKHQGKCPMLYTALLPSVHLPFLGRGPLKDIPDPSRLLLEELGILCTLLAPGGVKRGGILVYQVCVLSPSGTPKVLNLESRREFEEKGNVKQWSKNHLKDFSRTQVFEGGVWVHVEKSKLAAGPISYLECRWRHPPPPKRSSFTLTCMTFGKMVLLK